LTSTRPSSLQITVETAETTRHLQKHGVDCGVSNFLTFLSMEDCEMHAISRYRKLVSANRSPDATQQNVIHAAGGYEVLHGHGGDDRRLMGFFADSLPRRASHH